MSSSCAVPHCLPNRNSTIGSALSDADKRKVFQQTRSMHVLRPPRLPDSLGILRRKFKCREKVSVGSRQRERCGVRFSASRDRKLPDRFRPNYVTSDRQDAQNRKFGLAPIPDIQLVLTTSHKRTLRAAMGHPHKRKVLIEAQRDPAAVRDLPHWERSAFWLSARR